MTPRPDPRELQRILALTPDEQEAERRTEEAAAMEEADRLLDQLRLATGNQLLRLSKKHQAAAARAHSCRNRRAWLWSKGARW